MYVDNEWLHPLHCGIFQGQVAQISILRMWLLLYRRKVGENWAFLSSALRCSRQSCQILLLALSVAFVACSKGILVVVMEVEAKRNHGFRLWLRWLQVATNCCDKSLLSPDGRPQNASELYTLHTGRNVKAGNHCFTYGMRDATPGKSCGLVTMSAPFFMQPNDQSQKNETIRDDLQPSIGID